MFITELLESIDRLNEIGIALSAESDTPKLLELIMMGAKSLTHADGGSLYFLKDGLLSFEIISNDSLDIQMGGTSGNEITFPAIPLLNEGKENHSNVVSHCVLSGNTINIADAYNEDGFDFTGTRIMAIADIFEALTASDRPNKKGKKLSECLNIMGFMKKEQHIDPDIFDIFIKHQVYLDYAEEFLEADQIDEIDEALIASFAG